MSGRGTGGGRGSGDGLVLAIDAGNSKTDVLVVSADDGTVLGAARGGGFQPQAVGVEAAVDVLARAVDEALAQAGAAGAPSAAPSVTPSVTPAVAPSVAHVSACLANADLPVEEEALARALHARAWGASTVVRNDTFAVLRAGVDEPRGVAVVCGAGINCVGMLPDGRTARFPALGRISGDWGGGAGLAEEALWHAARAEDGRGEPTELARALPAHFGLGSMYALVEALHLGHVPAVRRHELAPVLFAVAEGGDTVALGLVERQAREVVALAVVALERLGLLGEPAPVLLGGGVLAAGHPRLNPRIAELLRERAPLAEPRVVTAPPVLGAALLALDHVGAPPEAAAALRARYGERYGEE
ncbi:BadF/BadG/BcrA/BcrD ATPase family protein [Streptomyces sp. TRM64462]|uniref:N-acetylglucosamine kinase n=1 Tax=Streptomyces sp. TRM64462 TaxID=2741726 RepID=UPI0028163A1D|nr:BadF/BadG/BcrA/BcrD ATPase family protein [Streptomyces sp. TRM64462]